MNSKESERKSSPLSLEFGRIKMIMSGSEEKDEVKRPLRLLPVRVKAKSI